MFFCPHQTWLTGKLSHHRIFVSTHHQISQTGSTGFIYSLATGSYDTRTKSLENRIMKIRSPNSFHIFLLSKPHGFSVWSVISCSLYIGPTAACSIQNTYSTTDRRFKAQWPPRFRLKDPAVLYLNQFSKWSVYQRSLVGPSDALDYYFELFTNLNRSSPLGKRNWGQRCASHRLISCG